MCYAECRARNSRALFVTCGWRIGGYEALNTLNIPLNRFGAAHKARQETLVSGRQATERRRCNPPLCAVTVHGFDKGCKILHGLNSAEKHRATQVLTDPLSGEKFRYLQVCMKQSFRDSLIRHIKDTGVGLTELAKGAGVSLDTLKKLNTGKNVSTTAEQAMAISAYFGQTLEEFTDPQVSADSQALEQMLKLLTPEQRKFLLAQIRGILQNRD